MVSASRAGRPAEPADLVDLAHLVTAYYTTQPDPQDPGQRVSFGTSGHRGSSLTGAFTDTHIAATTQAIVEYRAAQGIAGPLFLGRDTHGLSEPAWATALEVLAANGVTVLIDAADRFTPTPAISHAILAHNRGRGPSDPGRADGVVVTEVAGGSDADRKGVIPGLVVTEVNQKQVATVDELNSLVDEAREAGRPAVLFKVTDPAGTSRFIAVRLG